jgi:hypothetical protein
MPLSPKLLLECLLPDGLEAARAQQREFEAHMASEGPGVGCMLVLQVLAKEIASYISDSYISFHRRADGLRVENPMHEDGPGLVGAVKRP